MLQYLVNATAIWLISLVLFDVFLRKESFHNYNRFYLLFTFLLGALLPLWQWQNDIMPYTGTFHKPIEKVIATKQDLVTVSTTSTVAFNWQQWILLCYLAGSVIALILLIADVLRMVQFYNKGTKTYSDGWKVVTTGKDHAPFSFYNILFVASRSQYSDEEWQMILIHEKRHTQLLHIIDLILMQVARIIFWFHPLVYIFNKRLLLVQEFQADGASYVKPDEYGTFLVEQALLQKAPSLSHSFNRTPIKNRIIMLTRRSKKSSRFKMVVIIPLSLIVIVCFSKNNFAQNYIQKGNTFIRSGTKIDFSNSVTDSTLIIDDETGGKSYQISTKMSRPKKMNGKDIQYESINEHGSFPLTISESSKQFAKYLLNNIKPLLEHLDDGQYEYSPEYVTVDETGKIAYYELPGIWKTAKPFPGATLKQIDSTQHIDIKIKKAIDKKVASLMANCPKFKILNANGVAMPYDLGVFEITISNHKCSIE